MADIVLNIVLDEEIDIPFPPIPDALEDFSAAAASGTEIDLGWTDPGLLAEEYELQWDTDVAYVNNNVPIMIAASPGGGSIYTKTGLVTATLYYFRIRAVNAGGVSAWVGITETTL